MNYLQVCRNLKRIIEFRDLYVRFIKAQKSGNSRTAWQVRQEMACLAPYVQRNLDQVGVGCILLQDAPAVGGRQYPTEVTLLAYQPQITAKYNLSERDMVLHFERAIGEYLRLRSRAFWNLFNPFWWIREILAGIVSLPFYLIGLAGFNQQVIEFSLGGRVFKLLAGLVIISGALATIVQFLLDHGWLSFS